jgi:HlyD family secretion protein
VRFTVDAYPDQTFRGTISQIRLNATVNQNVVTYPVIIEVSNPDQALRPNMTANVVIDVATARDVLRVPNAALRFRPEETAVAAASSPEEQAARSGGEKGPAAAMKQFDRTAGGGQKRGARKPGQTVYEIAGVGTDSLKPVEIKTGITDGRFTQVTGGDLTEGTTVVIGLVTTKAEGPKGVAGPGGARRF